MMNSAGKPLHQFFACLTDAVSAAKQSPDWRGGYRATDTEFSGATFEQAATMATMGWPEGARLATERSARVVDRLVQATADTTTDQITWDVTGIAFDVGTYLSGEPECWHHMSEVATKRGIHICVNAAASGGVPAEILQARGITIASLVLALQSRGYPVTVDVVEVSSASQGTQSLVVRVIEANGSPLDIDRLAFALGHPAMLRAIVANAYGNYDQWGHGIPQSKGRPLDAPTYDLYIEGCHLDDTHKWSDESTAQAWVISEYLKQTGA